MKKKMSKEERYAEILEDKYSNNELDIIKMGLFFIVFTIIVGIIIALVLIYGCYK